MSSAADAGRKASFAPVADARTRLLVLGSLPGEKSLAAAQYYANPQNQFWRLMQAVTGAPLLSLPYGERLEMLRHSEDGFEIAEADFRLRGGGDPLGLKQSGFPAYRFADPIRHRSLLLAAADDARLLLGRDPDLASERGQAVRLLEALFDWKNERPSAD